MSQAAQRSRYVLKRLLQAVPVVLAIIVVNFLLLQLAEGDAVDVLAGEAGSATPEYMAQLREKFGLDQPVPDTAAHGEHHLAGRRFWNCAWATSGLKS